MTEYVATASPAAVPSPAASPRVALGSTLQAGRTTAVLLGSGVSASAGVLTGWQVALELVRRVAVLEGRGSDVGGDPAGWWAATGRGQPRYDDLVASLAPTDPDRRSLLRPYFEEATDGGPAVPGNAHRALARLAAKGRVPVILTTNFDRLMERALDAEGVAPQVLTEPSQVRGMTPLVHAGVTLVKLHGDYAAGRMLNTEGELAHYSRPWRTLLRRVFQEYGLLVVGWSAEYDVALVQAARQSVGRRYAWYWAAHHGALSESARRLVEARGAHVLESSGADELLLELEQRVVALDALASRRTGPRRDAPRYRILDGKPPEWAEWPPFVIQAAAVLGPVTVDQSGQIGPDQREAVVASLSGGLLERTLGRDLVLESASRRPGMSDDGPVESPAPLRPWSTPPNSDQSTSRATLRLGGDGTTALSVVVELTLPPFQNEANARIRVLVGMNPATAFSLDTVGAILHAVVSTATRDLPPVLTDALPPDASLARMEVSWEMPTDDRYGNAQPGSSSQIIDTSSLGSQAKQRPFAGRYAELIGDEVADVDVRRFVVRALRTTALDVGYLDPRTGMRAVADALGVSDGPSP